jgi:hypothetical protein
LRHRILTTDNVDEIAKESTFTKAQLDFELFQSKNREVMVVTDEKNNWWKFRISPYLSMDQNITIVKDELKL